MIFDLVRSITLLTFRSINTTYKCSVSPSSAVFTLKDTRVYISISDHGDVSTNVKTFVD